MIGNKPRARHIITEERVGAGARLRCKSVPRSLVAALPAPSSAKTANRSGSKLGDAGGARREVYSAADELINVPLSDLQIFSKRRPVDPERVCLLAASISRIGLRTPITVRLRLARPSGAELIAGLHRVEAAKLLGWTSIAAVPLNDDEGASRLWKLEENLQRAELNALDHAEHITAWMTLARSNQISGQVVRKSAGRPESGIALAARSLPVAGMTEEARRKAVERAINIERIADEAKSLARTLGLANNQAALLAIAKQATPAAQVTKARELAGRHRKSRSTRTSAELTASDANSRTLKAAGGAGPTQINEAETDVVARFCAAWEGTDACAIWQRAAPEIHDRIVCEVLRYFPIPDAS
jgi:ParB/RepB/Spo0J family partition protein